MNVSVGCATESDGISLEYTLSAIATNGHIVGDNGEDRTVEESLCSRGNIKRRGVCGFATCNLNVLSLPNNTCIGTIEAVNLVACLIGIVDYIKTRVVNVISKNNTLEVSAETAEGGTRGKAELGCKLLVAEVVNVVKSILGSSVYCGVSVYVVHLEVIGNKLRYGSTNVSAEVLEIHRAILLVAPLNCAFVNYVLTVAIKHGSSILAKYVHRGLANAVAIKVSENTACQLINREAVVSAATGPLNSYVSTAENLHPRLTCESTGKIGVRGLTLVHEIAVSIACINVNNLVCKIKSKYVSCPAILCNSGRKGRGVFSSAVGVQHEGSALLEVTDIEHIAGRRISKSEVTGSENVAVCIACNGELNSSKRRYGVTEAGNAAYLEGCLPLVGRITKTHRIRMVTGNSVYLITCYVGIVYYVNRSIGSRRCRGRVTEVAAKSALCAAILIT